MGGKSLNLKLDEYVDLYRNPEENFLTKFHLNQIIGMHGFIKLTKFPKAALMEEFRTINLESPFRSTLKENISSSAFLNPDEVKKDLDDLLWNECIIQSIQIHQSGGKENLLCDDVNHLPANLDSSSIVIGKDAAGKPKQKRKRRTLKKLGTVAPPPSTPPTDVTPADSSCLSLGSC
ncbi:hypothetical protein BVC80_7967g5 [Macleaya cordata]|uniref:DUF7787 domain-containing protein n=1 Tax=Macleaya cordata TaxID=56857 RepID=A0A200Q0P6_MACCD|nr:hypothetical protein BVC80_7967g5 [Macleaya cordata]